MTELGCSLLQRLLEADTGYRGPRVDCEAGHQARFVGYRDKNIDTVLGRVAVRRAYYQCPTCQRGVVPRDTELDVAGVSLSPGLRKMVARTAAEHIRADSTAILDRTVAVAPPARLPDMLYVAVDGTGVPMVPAATTGRHGKTPDRPARTHEVKLACLFTQTTVDEQDQPVRDPDSTSYLGTPAPVGQFATLVHAQARRRGCEHIRQLVVLGHGAPWICNLATQILPEAPRSWTSTTPANTSTPSPPNSPPPSTTRQPSWRPASPTSTPATSKPSSPRPTSSPSPSPTPPRQTKPWPTSRPPPNGCATPTSTSWACSSAQEPSKQAAKRSSANA